MPSFTSSGGDASLRGPFPLVLSSASGFLPPIPYFIAPLLWLAVLEKKTTAKILWKFVLRFLSAVPLARSTDKWWEWEGGEGDSGSEGQRTLPREGVGSGVTCHAVKGTNTSLYQKGKECFIVTC